MGRLSYRQSVRGCFCLLLLLLATASCASAEPRRVLLERIEKSIAAGNQFLVSRQQADGTWRSKTYGLLKDGTSLTPLVLVSLSDTATNKDARRKALVVVDSWIGKGADGTAVTVVPQYPVYSASLCLARMVGESAEKRPDDTTIWRKYLESFQLNGANGWTPDDARFGGWGYSHEPPRWPGDGQVLSPLDEPNLSATVFALEGLAAVDPMNETTAMVRCNSREFIFRCQNWDDDNSRFNDGGFHFMLDDVVRNKPGVAGVDELKKNRFASYGSATADGLRCLILTGIKPDHPRAIAARRWLIEHFGDGSHSGHYPDDRKHLQPSLDFYYAASVARALSLSRPPTESTVTDDHWAFRLASRLVGRQRLDGAWVNPAVDVREDDPLIATSLALQALEKCRMVLRNQAE